MKQVIKRVSVSDSMVFLDQVSEKKYYGIRRNDNLRGFVTREKYNDGNFVVICPNGLTYGNRYDYLDAPTLSQCLGRACESPSFEAHEFDTFRELMKWVSEGEDFNI
jgi:hypothetical protein